MHPIHCIALIKRHVLTETLPGGGEPTGTDGAPALPIFNQQKEKQKVMKNIEYHG